MNVNHYQGKGINLSCTKEKKMKLQARENLLVINYTGKNAHICQLRKAKTTTKL